MKLINENTGKTLTFQLTEDLIDVDFCTVCKHGSDTIYVIALKNNDTLYELAKDLFIKQLNIPDNFVDMVMFNNYYGFAFNVLIDPFECCFAIAGKVDKFEFTESYNCSFDFLEMQLIYKYNNILDDKVKSGDIVFRKYTP